MKLSKLTYFISSILLLITFIVLLIFWFLNTQNIFNEIQIFFKNITGNMFSLVIFADLIVFSIITIIWMIIDSKRRKMKIQTRIILLLSALMIGSPVLLLYLAFRKKDE